MFVGRFPDGQSLDGLTEGEETDMEDEDISLGLNSNEELVSVQGQDGQQYVVLEVIQLEVSSPISETIKVVQ